MEYKTQIVVNAEVGKTSDFGDARTDGANGEKRTVPDFIKHFSYHLKGRRHRHRHRHIVERSSHQPLFTNK